MIFFFKQKQSTLSAQEVPKVDIQKNDQPQSSDGRGERFKTFTSLPLGLRSYVADDLIGTPLEDIDPFYKDKQVMN